VTTPTFSTTTRDGRHGRGGRGDGEDHEREIRGREKRTLALLGLPTFGLALAITTVTTYLPVVARSYVGSTALIGVIVGIEGLMALWVPLLAGSWSDRLRTRWGGRLPFLVVGTPVIAVALLGVGVVHSVGLLVAVVAVFFAAYFVAYEPYRALYPDLVDDEIAGRAQSTQAIFRGAATGVALLGGGLLVGLSHVAPFLAGAVVMLGAIAVFLVSLRRREGREDAGSRQEVSARGQAARVWRLLRGRPALRAFLVANGLWELSLGALKTWVFLYLTQGLGLASTPSAAVIGGAAVFVLAGAVVSGKLGDRYGRTRVLAVALPIYGLGLFVPFVFANHYVVAVITPFVTFAGGAIMALPYAVLIPLMPEDERGALTGFYTFSRGLGTSLGPLLAGAAISIGSSAFSATQGYQAMWAVCAVAVILSLPFLRRLRRDTEQ
jgi:MFS family permease